METFSKTTRNLVNAIVVGPLSIIPAMMIGLSVVFVLMPTAFDDLLRSYKEGLMVSLVGVVYGYGFTILYGVPAYLILKKLNIANLFSVIVASLIPAIVYGVVLSSIEMVFLIGYFSLIVGIRCWFLATKGLPK